MRWKYRSRFAALQALRTTQTSSESACPIAGRANTTAGFPSKRAKSTATGIVATPPARIRPQASTAAADVRSWSREYVGVVEVVEVVDVVAGDATRPWPPA